ncbi:MAG: substrate-binding domain-containing protein [Burkholderiaceae bacterium]
MRPRPRRPHDGDCDAAGFHIPSGPCRTRRWPTTRAGWPAWSSPSSTWPCAAELMVRAKQRECFSLQDLTRGDVRFINRQAGSGTRLLLEGLLRARDVDSTRIAGFEQGEYTHAAVAACVASSMADIGFGLEPPAGTSSSTWCPSPVSATSCCAATT